jgi:hypothetical protein
MRFDLEIHVSVGVCENRAGAGGPDVRQNVADWILAAKAVDRAGRFGKRSAVTDGAGGPAYGQES